MFEPPVSTATAGRPAFLNISDLDEDGDVNVVVPLFATIGGGTPNTHAVLMNAGDGTLQAPQYYSLGTSVIRTVVNDVNGDNRPDIITAAYSSRDVYVLTNLGSGAFAATRYSTPSAPHGLAVDDFSGDGLPDIAVSHQTSTPKLGLLINQGQFALIVEQSESVTVDSGETVTLHVGVNPPEDLSFQWYFGAAPLQDDDRIVGTATDTLQITPGVGGDSGLYRVSISNGQCAMDSHAAEVSVNVTCAADIAPIGGNGAVDIDDLTAVVLGWGSCSALPPPCFEDVNFDGGVGVDDLVAVILGWGACPR